MRHTSSFSFKYPDAFVIFIYNAITSTRIQNFSLPEQLANPCGRLRSHSDINKKQP